MRQTLPCLVTALMCAVVLLAANLPAAIAITARTRAPALSSNRHTASNRSGYWHTSGTSIVDERGKRVRIAAVNWYGMDSSYWVPPGLDFQPYWKIMDLVKRLGYNTIRVSCSNELVETNPVVTEKIRANPQFRGVHALQVLDAIVRYAQHIGLKIILDNGRSHAARPNEVNHLDEPLWYTAHYPESSWIRDWTLLARRYRGNDAVVGVDLRNEPHTNGPGPWNLHAYLHQGATWGPYRGVDNPATDWRLAAERGGNAVLRVNPHLLIFVEGLQMYPDSRARSGVAAYWWGSVFKPANAFPIRLSVKHQLVYEPHEWGPRKSIMPWFAHMTYASLVRVWHDHWSFLLEGPNATPVWLGEFGTCTSAPTCVDKQERGNQAQWFHLLLRYLRDHPQIGWSFFALDGTNSNDHAANNGLLNPNWDGVANVGLQHDLTQIQP